MSHFDGRVEFEDGRLLDVGGIEVWCHDDGKDGEPLVLLGGPSVGHFHFDFVRPYLGGHRLVTWEPRGFGPSGHLRTCSKQAVVLIENTAEG